MFKALLLSTSVILAAGPAWASEAIAEPAAETEGFSWDAEATVTTDYRYRGVSLSDENPALQVGANLYAPSGWYAGVWSSTIEEYGVGADGDGAKAELDFNVGRSFEAAGFEFDVGAAAYTYPDGSDVNYVEFPVSVSRTSGPWTVAAGLAYAPAQTGTGGEANTYVSGSVQWAWPEHPVVLSASIGQEDGAWYRSKVDWSAGARFDVGRVSLSLLYVDTDDRSADAALVGAVGLKFGG